MGSLVVFMKDEAIKKKKDGDEKGIKMYEFYSSLYGRKLW